VALLIRRQPGRRWRSKAGDSLVLCDCEASAECGMGIAEVSADVAIADALIVPKDATTVSLVFWSLVIPAPRNG